MATLSDETLRSLLRWELSTISNSLIQFLIDPTVNLWLVQLKGYVADT